MRLLSRYDMRRLHGRIPPSADPQAEIFTLIRPANPVFSRGGIGPDLNR